MASYASTNPVDLVRNHSSQILEILQQDTSQSLISTRHNIEAIAEPLFDFQRLTALAVGPDWSRASPTLKDRLTDAFKCLFVRVYSQIMMQFKAVELSINETALMQDGDRRATVKSIFTFQNEPKIIKIDHVLVRSADNWQVIDIRVDAVSLVNVYRNEFKQKIQAYGMDGLIEYLESKSK